MSNQWLWKRSNILKKILIWFVQKTFLDYLFAKVWKPHVTWSFPSVLLYWGSREQRGVNFIFGQILPTISLLCLIFLRVWPKEDPVTPTPLNFGNYIFIRGHKSFTTHIVLKSHRIKMRLAHVIRKTIYSPLVIATMALWPLVHLGT